MICVSKADENFHRHLSWNQAPSPLAPTSTTRQDLNGISNLREHVNAGHADGNGMIEGILGPGGQRIQLRNHSSDPGEGPGCDTRRPSPSVGKHAICFLNAGKLLGGLILYLNDVSTDSDVRTVLVSKDGKWW